MNLDDFDEIDSYRKYFMDVNFWQSYVAVAMEKVGLVCQNVRGGVAGTYPTFIVDDRYVVKFFGRLFRGDLSYQAELNANLILKATTGVPAPGLIAQGKLKEDDPGWPWHYIVYEYIDGISVGEIWQQLSQSSMDTIAGELGKIVRCLHSIPLIGNHYFLPEWVTYRQYLERQKKNCVAIFKDQVGIPFRFCQQLESFLLPIDVLVKTGKNPHLIHADLTRDHLLGSVKNGDWETLGVIDFGDAMVGDLFYELIALHLDLFRCNKRLLRKFLDIYGFDRSLREDFTVKAMNLTLLHQFGAGILADLFHRYPNLHQVDTLKDLADVLWGLEN